jgi:hypothetical protein
MPRFSANCSAISRESSTAAARQEIDLGQLLPGKCQPTPQFRIELALFVHVDRDVHQGTGRRNLDALGAQALHRPADRLQRAIQIRPPDVPSIHHTERKQQPGGRIFESNGQLAGAANEIQVQPSYRQAEGQFQVSRRSEKYVAIKTLIPGVDEASRL